MGAHVSRTDFEWVYTEEPHASRRKEILGICYIFNNKSLFTDVYFLIVIANSCHNFYLRLE